MSQEYSACRPNCKHNVNENMSTFSLTTSAPRVLKWFGISLSKFVNLISGNNSKRFRGGKISM